MLSRRWLADWLATGIFAERFGFWKLLFLGFPGLVLLLLLLSVFRTTRREKVRLVSRTKCIALSEEQTIENVLESQNNIDAFIRSVLYIPFSPTILTTFVHFLTQVSVQNVVRLCEAYCKKAQPTWLLTTHQIHPYDHHWNPPTRRKLYTSVHRHLVMKINP